MTGGLDPYLFLWLRNLHPTNEANSVVLLTVNLPLLLVQLVSLVFEPTGSSDWCWFMVKIAHFQREPEK